MFPPGRIYGKQESARAQVGLLRVNALFWVKDVLCLPDSVKETNSHATNCVCACTLQLSVVCIAP